jgi:multidrug efflux pump subunit AcrA (membrane-fusion protein)
MSQQTPNAPGQVLALPGLGDNEDDANLASPSPPWWRRRGVIIGIVILLLAILLGGLLISFLNRRPRVTYQSGQAAPGNLSVTISATGPLQGGVYNINFSGTGTISQIDVKVGQSVVKGQILAKLDKTSLQDAVDQAQATVNADVAAVTNSGNSSSATRGQSSASIAAAETALSNAEANLTKVKAQSSASIAAAQTALNNAKTNLTNVKAQSAANVQVALLQMQQVCGPTPPPNPTLACQLAEAQYKQAQANAASANGNAQAQVNTATQSLKTAKAQAAANNATAQEQVNTAAQQLNTALAQANVSNTTANGQVGSAQGQLQTALQQLKTAQDNLRNAALKAPHDGTVSIVNGNVGGTPGASQGTSSTASSGGTFIQIVDASALQVVANVNETDTANLQVGQPAQFTVNAYGQRLFKGTVSAIAPNGQTVSNVVTYPVTIDVDANDLKGARLLPGMTANVTVTVLQRSNVLLIPVDAVNFARLVSSNSPTAGTPQLITQQQAGTAMNQARQMLNALQSQRDISAENPIPAFVVERLGNQFIAKPVVLGLTDGMSYEVLSGLVPGETIIIGTGSGSFSGPTPASGGPGG